MPVRPFVPYPDKRLRSAAAPVGTVTEAHREIWQDMIETMDAMPGVGLAAPQIGVMLRLAVVDASEERGQAIRMADPEIVSASEEVSTYPEGSPNLPGVNAKISRPARVTVAFTDHLGMRVRQEFEGLWATSVQHQIDHLNGKMYIDHLSRVKREMLVKKSRRSV
ncbi:peptide deformylase [Gymnodinialimonas ceratoperidinii]|uniref:Peptide deformylase-like n=1 Tax=Gymnodinialimonas ceratoperidinii TaxID=2856823 RepID=A0A8F6YCV7_9RHOB|nr:peptide deformylase [Gymnodinialimonas ceratoperidinii]QXT39760.1 peptide deformylase [Gymnodinialimonas ceratoperidinii]